LLQISALKLGGFLAKFGPNVIPIDWVLKSSSPFRNTAAWLANQVLHVWGYPALQIIVLSDAAD